MINELLYILNLLNNEDINQYKNELIERIIALINDIGRRL